MAANVGHIGPTIEDNKFCRIDPIDQRMGIQRPLIGREPCCLEEFVGNSLLHIRLVVTGGRQRLSRCLKRSFNGRVIQIDPPKPFSRAYRTLRSSCIQAFVERSRHYTELVRLMGGFR